MNHCISDGIRCSLEVSISFLTGEKQIYSKNINKHAKGQNME